MTPNSATGQFELVPYGQVATRQWLRAHGATRHGLDNALKSGKLQPLSRGVVARPGAAVGWEGLAASLNRMSDGEVYVGGRTALELLGFAHYARKAPVIRLYSHLPYPSWLKKLDLGVALEWHRTRRVWDEDQLRDSLTLREVDGPAGKYRVATPERAYLELLSEQPERVSFEHADQLMQGLTSLSPQRLDALLKACRHVRVKRLFFFFASRYDYPWLKRLDRSGYDLGSGKRVVVPGGKLDKNFLITVPEDFYGSE